ncbi:uracil-DNA glycosylase [Bacillus thermotolerans]|uniref:Uracil-DNA glycosylase n=1 Tax=Bacillus thermotolerans TaxID=1221996 RepID=A0A0F5HTW2_BACTR|nr:uracil-DNA glycosylase [Bacillus thermotolerans]KKB36470.1 Uracil-DNA glycosylase, family 1 [Bacillus thermotolerans]KKB40125.1 Uracil-DNA glycosylase, family 1 [Bacillus thermotolerans]KKB41060.1 Uracil-DNA glycosylase, family 1 [Bacillus thermotolerans]
MSKSILKNDWAELLEPEFEQPYYKELREFLKKEYQTETVYPEMNDIYNALHYTAYKDIKVVILGQDPYHGPGQAHGLSFSVQPDVTPPPSLKNIFKELQSDLGCQIPNNGYLVPWAEQGVLLLNTVLTVRKGKAHSHRNKGWEKLTDRIISLINERKQPVVFILWGRPAQKKLALIDQDKHCIIQSPHPSPLSASKGFFGSRPFSKANDCLKQLGEEPINWQLPNR